MLDEHAGDEPVTDASEDESMSEQEVVGPKIVGEEGKPTITTASGLKYIVLEEGDGQAAQTGDMVTMQYTGWLTDGTKFDSSADHDSDFEFQLGVGQVIKGWDEGVS